MTTIMPYYVYVRDDTGWHVARYYPKQDEYYLTGNPKPIERENFHFIGNKVDMAKGGES